MSENIVQTESADQGEEKSEDQQVEHIEEVSGEVKGEDVKVEEVTGDVKGVEVKVEPDLDEAQDEAKKQPDNPVKQEAGSPAEARKRAPEEEEGSRKERRSGVVLKVLCPFYSVGSVIGKGGERILEMKQKTGAAITISKYDSRFPGTKERVISIQSDCEEIKEIVKFVQLRIREDNPPPSAKAIDIEGNEKRKKICRLVVADGVLGKIIGKGGESIKELKEKHGVNIKTTNKADFAFEFGERLVSIEGEVENVQACSDEVIEMVFEDSRSNLTYFTDYASLSRAAGAYGGGYNGYEGRGGGHYVAPRGNYGGRNYGGYQSGPYGYGGGYGRGGGRRY